MYANNDQSVVVLAELKLYKYKGLLNCASSNLIGLCYIAKGIYVGVFSSHI